MLEIIYDADLVQLPIHEDFTFFGIPRGDNCEVTIENFSVTHHLASGDVFVPGPRIGNFRQHDQYGRFTPRSQGRIEFIVTVTPESIPYITALMGCDGLWVCDKLFETRVSQFLQPRQSKGNFHRVPGYYNFYFLGEHTNVVQ